MLQGFLKKIIMEEIKNVLKEQMTSAEAPMTAAPTGVKGMTRAMSVDSNPTDLGTTHITSNPKRVAIMKLQKKLKSIGAKIKIDGNVGVETYKALQTAFPGLHDAEKAVANVQMINRFIDHLNRVTPERYAAADEALWKKEWYSSGGGGAVPSSDLPANLDSTVRDTINTTPKVKADFDRRPKKLDEKLLNNLKRILKNI